MVSPQQLKSVSFWSLPCISSHINMTGRGDNIRVKDPIAVFNGGNLKAVKYTVIYIVNNVEEVTLDEKALLQSPVFHVGLDDKHQARIICNYKGGCHVSAACKTNGCTYVQFLDEDRSRSKVRREITLSYIKNDIAVDIYSDLNIAMTKYETPTSTSWGRCLACFGPHTCIPSTWLSNGTLTLQCDITVHVAPLSANDSLPIAMCAEVHQNYLMDDIKRLLGNTELADISIQVENKTLKAHKVILAARSPVFARMFQTNMKESITCEVNITDMDFSTLESLLIYMYTDNVPSLDTLGESLLSAAEKYQLNGLKAKCEEALAKGLTVSNAARIFITADLHRANFLKDKAIEFILKNRDEVFATAEWKRAKDDKPLELAALLL